MNRASVIEVSGLSAWDHKLTVMRLYFCLVLPLLRASGKDKTMKRIPKTPVEFDYDLWTTEDGKCMVRVKLTGEVTEVARDVMKILRAEEKKLRRSFTGDASEDREDGNETVLSLDALPDDDVQSSSWLADPHDFVSELQTEMLLSSFRFMLSPLEREIFDLCLLNGLSVREYAAQKGMPKSSVWDIIKKLRKDFQKIF